MNPLVQSKNTTILSVLIALTLGCFGLSPQARAVCQEGCDTVNFNTFLGDDALITNTTGFDNTAIGALALQNNTIGSSNTAIGIDTLRFNTTGVNNTAGGGQALLLNTTGMENTAYGAWALSSNTTGSENTAVGVSALQGQTNGVNYDNNTAIGAAALFLNAGSDNTATGFSALISNSTGNSNTANGTAAMDRNTTGSNNTATGFNALLNNTTGSKNIALGFLAGTNLTSGDDNIDIGNPGRAGESSTIRIGRDHTATFIAAIRGVPITGGEPVAVNPGGQLGVRPSSARYKETIQPMDKASEAILALKPVTFRYKKALDAKSLRQFGLVAEEVAKVEPDLVVSVEQGKPFSVRYDEVNAMLLNEFLKEHP